MSLRSFSVFAFLVGCSGASGSTVDAVDTPAAPIETPSTPSTPSASTSDPTPPPVDPPKTTNPPAKGSWRIGAEMPTPRRRVAAAYAPDGRIFVAGGETDVAQTRTTVVEIYNPKTDTWTTGPGLPEALEWSSAAFGTDGKLYALSGSVHNYRLDLASNTWTLLAAPSQIRTAAALVVSGKDFVLLGGAGTTTPIAYHPDTNTWTDMPAYATSAIRTAPGGAMASDGSLLMIGGFETNKFMAQSSVFRLPAGATAWENAPAMPISVGLLAAVTDSSGRIYAVGGEQSKYGGKQYGANVLVLENGAWSEVAPMGEPRVSLAVCADGAGKLYAFGGEALGPNGQTSVVGNVEIFTP